MTDPTLILHFHPDPQDVDCDTETRQAVDGHWSHTAWLPLLGPSSWLLWGTITAAVSGTDHATLHAGELARNHGLSPARLTAPLQRLERFRVIHPVTATAWTVRTHAQPLNRHQLRQVPDRVTGIQHDLFPRRPRTSSRR